jgi:WhiB family transcriptional regulator, redox-sensing transcriptional regulator
MSQLDGAQVASPRWQASRLITRGYWRSAAACQSADPELFFPISDSGKSLEQVAEAKAICAGCPVRRDCLTFALRTGQVYGIWGGTTTEERAIARRSLVSEPLTER